ncbi:3-phosphoshikimate 1-carboxyvinyltransferase [Desulfosoma caldarium]|uniref:3-phosphoshikimate 1-carboxyvinyltransferase n=1 Tax=Desulfosoma caldarium TaxID=610254 RepID=A0A3N1UV98_9BACT|nr:3-phosphoshikimate 1-carboxyvinyltransferase [Desulfosoma caldarium]ROQ93349.1 3-phosphoshikimate 1-carboxyvinyltransferase [Desulfosoma caldarium]
MNEMADTRTIPCVSRVRGRVAVPGSKSVTHRALILAALSEEECVIENALDAEDTRITAEALRRLGVRIHWHGTTIRVRPAPHRWISSPEPLALSNSGTSLRLLMGLAAVGRGTFVFDGSTRLRQRPVGPLADALKPLGVGVRFLGRDLCPPLELQTNGLHAGETLVDASESSQYLSSLLIAATQAEGPVLVRWKDPVASWPYVTITLSMMTEVGLEFSHVEPRAIRVPAPQRLGGFRLEVEGDCSSASYFWAASALTRGDVVTYPLHSSSLQGDCRFLEVLASMGCRIQWEDRGVRVQGPDRLQPVHVDMNTMPDMVPTLAVVCAFADGPCTIGNVAHLRIKESDRLDAVATELQRLGVFVEQYPDGLRIQGPPQRGGAINTYNDHRIAMAFAVLGLKVPGTMIRGASTVSKSFPEFWAALHDLLQQSRQENA